MTELSPSPEPVQAEKPRRSWMPWVVALYALSMVAAVLVLWRGASRPTQDGAKPEALRAAKGMLSAVGEKDAVGVVSISGAIYRSDGGGLWPRGLSQWERRLERFGKRKDIKAVVLSIDSPGGSVGSVQELNSRILRMRRELKKPVVAQLGDVAASGGYYLAASCDKIVSQPGTLLGSIGVIFRHSNIEGLLGKVGVRSEAIKSGKLKDIGSMSRPMTKEERELLQGLIDNAYGQFVKAVAQGRGMPEETLRPLADGRIFTGEQALALGLVDQLGDFEDAVTLAGRLGGIRGRPRVVRDVEGLSDMLEMLDSRWEASVLPEPALFRALGRAAYSGLEYRWNL